MESSEQGWKSSGASSETINLLGIDEQHACFQRESKICLSSCPSVCAILVWYSPLARCCICSCLRCVTAGSPIHPSRFFLCVRPPISLGRFLSHNECHSSCLIYSPQYSPWNITLSTASAISRSLSLYRITADSRVHYTSPGLDSRLCLYPTMIFSCYSCIQFIVPTLFLNCPVSPPSL